MIGRIRAAVEERDWPVVATLCADQIRQNAELGLDDWCAVRTVFGWATLNLPEKARGEYVSLAIAGLEEVVSSGRLEDSDLRVGRSYRDLASLHESMANRDDGRQHRAAAIASYERALGAFERAGERGEDWVTVKVALGVLLMKAAKGLTPDEIRSAHPASSAVATGLSRAISHFHDALEVYGADDWTERREETIRLIDSAHRMLDALRRDPRRLQ